VKNPVLLLGASSKGKAILIGPPFRAGHYGFLTQSRLLPKSMVLKVVVASRKRLAYGLDKTALSTRFAGHP